MDAARTPRRVGADRPPFDAQAQFAPDRLGRVAVSERIAQAQEALQKYKDIKRNTPSEIIDAKARVSAELDNLVDAGTDYHTVEDGEAGHIHKNDFWVHGDVLFKLGNNFFRGRINAIPKERGNLFSTVTQIKDVTQDIRDSYGENPKATFLRDISMDNVPQFLKNGKENISTPETIERMDISLDPETDSVFPADGTRLSRKSVEEVTVPAPWSPGERKGLYISAE